MSSQARLHPINWNLLTWGERLILFTPSRLIKQRGHILAALIQILFPHHHLVISIPSTSLLLFFFFHLPLLLVLPSRISWFKMNAPSQIFLYSSFKKTNNLIAKNQHRPPYSEKSTTIMRYCFTNQGIYRVNMSWLYYITFLYFQSQHIKNCNPIHSLLFYWRSWRMLSGIVTYSFKS